MPNSQTEIATFAGGCFWGVEELFRTTPGVISTRVGYTGGSLPNPIYEQVCTGSTGHAEAIEITFDPTKILYKELVHTFFRNHNPVTRNRQGPDIGTQYRSAIFFHSSEQQKIAESVKMEVEKSGVWKAPIVTEILPASTFYPAEDYHQQYLAKRGMRSCHTSYN